MRLDKNFCRTAFSLRFDVETVEEDGSCLVLPLRWQITKMEESEND